MRTLRGSSIAYLHASVAIDDPLAVANLPGRFVIEQGQRQEVSSDHKPEVAAQLSVSYSLGMWSSPLPTDVHQIAYGQT